MSNDVRVFLLHHTHGPSQSETYKLLGVFSSEARAYEALLMAKDMPGFRDYPDGFSIDPYTLDKRCWVEGFISGGEDDVFDR